MSSGRRPPRPGRSERRDETERKRAYRRPELVEYGDIIELTRSDGGTGFDGISGTGGV